MELPKRFEAIGEQDMGQGVVLEWVDNGRIVVFRLEQHSQKSVDFWFDVVSQVFADYPVDEPLIVLHDMRQASIGPYLREKSKILTENAARFSKGRFAVVMSDNPLAQLVRLFVNIQSRRLTARERRAFTDYDEALTWLRADNS
jgi:hypothetical protein